LIIKLHLVYDKKNNNNYDSLERISLFFSLFGSLIFILDF